MCVHLIGPDGRMEAQIAIFNHGDALRGRKTQERIAKIIVEAMKHLHDIINCGNCSGSRQSARLALRALKGGSENG